MGILQMRYVAHSSIERCLSSGRLLSVRCFFYLSAFSRMSYIKITRLMLHRKIRDCKSESAEVKKSAVLEHLKNVFNTNGDNNATKALEKYVREQFFAPYFRLWKACSRTEKIFVDKHNIWLQEEMEFPQIVYRCLPSTSSEHPSESKL